MQKNEPYTSYQKKKRKAHTGLNHFSMRKFFYTYTTPPVSKCYFYQRPSMLYAVAKMNSGSQVYLDAQIK